MNQTLPFPEMAEPENIVAAFTEPELDKYSLLEKTLQASGFLERLESEWKESGKSKEDFRIVIKPNLSMMLHRSDVGTYTDPFLVIHLLRLLLQRGFTNLAVVESQNLYGNWFENRGVLQVAARAGFFPESVFNECRGETMRKFRVRGGGVDAQVPLIDMTLDAVAHELGPEAGEILVGRAWREADFRISFPKLKTHFYSTYTLSIKNIYGCLPVQDKVRAYHCRKVVGKWTAQLINAFPVHFSIVDGYSAADGWMGVKMKAVCKKPHTMIAGADIQAVDHYGALLMNENPKKSILYRALAKVSPPRSYRAIGNARPLTDWRKSPYLFARLCQLIEANAWIMDFSGSLATGGNDPCFPPKRATRAGWKKALYFLSLPVNFLSDLGFLRLRARKKLFRKTIKKRRKELPRLAGFPWLISRVSYLSPSELKELAGILRRFGGQEPEISGHYFIFASGEVPFCARLSTGNLAAAEILKAAETREQAEGLAEELLRLAELYPALFGPDSGYPYCFR